MIERERMKLIIEAALLAAGEPVDLERLENLFTEEERPERSELKALLEEMKEEYTTNSFQLKQLASGYCFQVGQDYASWMLRLWEERPAKFSRALLETLAIIAYRQPITRAEIEDIRGVVVSTSIIKTLLDERNWIRVLGYKEVPGKPGIYGTTKEFLDYFNLKSLNELPSLKEIQNLDQLVEQFDQQLELDLRLHIENNEENTIVEATHEKLSTVVVRREEEDEQLLNELSAAIEIADATIARIKQNTFAYDEEESTEENRQEEIAEPA